LIASCILCTSYWKSPNKIRDLFGPFLPVPLDTLIGWVKMRNLREKAAKSDIFCSFPGRAAVQLNLILKIEDATEKC
jgi:hypothetical protein